MPRRSRCDAENPARRRVRTGCVTCRQRKIKCDETQPSCRNCSRRGVDCCQGMQLKWEHEFASRGLAFGRRGCWRKGASTSPASPVASSPRSPGCLAPFRYTGHPRVQSRHFINTLFSEFEDGQLPECRQNEDRQVVFQTPAGSSSFSSPRGPLSTMPFLSNSHSWNSLTGPLLEYYLLRLCPLTTPSCRHSSPFASLVVPALHMPDHKDIQHAVMALAARHYSLADADQPSSAVWSKPAVALQATSIHALRRRLSAATSTSTWDPQILVLMMFLCLYEIVDSCDYRWVIHLRASQNVIRQSRQLLPADADSEHALWRHDLSPLTSFCERFFAFQDVISRTACENEPLFGSDYWERQGGQADRDGASEVDSWMGCSTTLVRVLCRIADLSRRRAREGILPAELDAETAVLEEQLDRDRDQYEALTRTRPADTAARAVTRLKREAVGLYLECILRDGAPATPAVARLVREILRGVSATVALGCTAGLSFPLFVAAVELDPLDDDSRAGSGPRRLILDTLAAMARQSPLANVERTRAVIEKVWRMRDMAVNEDSSSKLQLNRTRPEKHGHVNDWGIFVGPYSQNISLA